MAAFPSIQLFKLVTSVVKKTIEFDLRAVINNDYNVLLIEIYHAIINFVLHLKKENKRAVAAVTTAASLSLRFEMLHTLTVVLGNHTTSKHRNGINYKINFNINIQTTCDEKKYSIPLFPCFPHMIKFHHK